MTVSCTPFCHLAPAHPDTNPRRILPVREETVPNRSHAAPRRHDTTAPLPLQHSVVGTPFVIQGSVCGCGTPNSSRKTRRGRLERNPFSIRSRAVRGLARRVFATSPRGGTHRPPDKTAARPIRSGRARWSRLRLWPEAYRPRSLLRSNDVIAVEAAKSWQVAKSAIALRYRPNQSNCSSFGPQRGHATRRRCMHSQTTVPRIGKSRNPPLGHVMHGVDGLPAAAASHLLRTTRQQLQPIHRLHSPLRFVRLHPPHGLQRVTFPAPEKRRKLLRGQW